MSTQPDRARHVDTEIAPSGPPQEVVAVSRPGVTRTSRVVAWLGWHLLELGCVALLGALAIWGSLWWAVPAGVVSAVWAVSEWRAGRRDTESRGEQ